MKKNNITVVFSSHLSKEENVKFMTHVSNTIGCKHNIHCYPNFNEFSLPQLYNRALGEYIDESTIFVFCHNDIIFKTRNWGKILLNKFNNPEYDYQIIGVAGSTYMPASGRWWDDRSKMVGIVEHTDGFKDWVSQYSKPISGVRDVVLIDGLFMAVDPTEIEHKFDENYRGFHFYDLSFCIPNYLDGCNVGVVTDIRILHKSMGVTNQEWEINRIQFVNENIHQLPINLEDNVD